MNSKFIISRLQRDSNLKELLRNSGVQYIAGIFTILLTLAQQMSTASILGALDYGRFAVVIGSTTLIMLIVDVRTWELGTKLFVRPILDKSYTEIVRTLTWLVLVDAVIGTIGSFLLVLLAEPLAFYFLKMPELDWLVRLYGLSIPFRLIGTGGSIALLRLYNRFDWLAIKSVVFAVVRLVLITGAALLGLGLTGVIIGAILIEVLNTIIILMMTLFLYQREMHVTRLIDLNRPQNFNEGRSLLVQLWISATLKGLQLETLIPITALMTSPVQVGLLRVALDIGDLINKLVAPLVVVFSSVIVKLYEEKLFTAFKAYIRQVFLLLSGLTLPFTFGIIFGGPFIFPLVLPDFEGVTPVAALVAIGYGVNVLFMWLRPAIMAMDLVWQQNIVGFVLTSITIIGVALLSSYYGGLGSAVSLTAFMSIHNAVLFILFQRKLQQTSHF
jgi:O-antigen/teichoic acid export membrane protein